VFVKIVQKWHTFDVKMMANLIWSIKINYS